MAETRNQLLARVMFDELCFNRLLTKNFKNRLTYWLNTDGRSYRENMLMVNGELGKLFGEIRAEEIGVAFTNRHNLAYFFDNYPRIADLYATNLLTPENTLNEESFFVQGLKKFKKFVKSGELEESKCLPLRPDGRISQKNERKNDTPPRETVSEQKQSVAITKNGQSVTIPCEYYENKLGAFYAKQSGPSSEQILRFKLNFSSLIEDVFPSVETKEVAPVKAKLESNLFKLLQQRRKERKKDKYVVPDLHGFFDPCPAVPVKVVTSTSSSSSSLSVDAVSTPTLTPATMSIPMQQRRKERKKDKYVVPDLHGFFDPCPAVPVKVVTSTSSSSSSLGVDAVSTPVAVTPSTAIPVKAKLKPNRMQKRLHQRTKEVKDKNANATPDMHTFFSSLFQNLSCQRSPRENKANSMPRVDVNYRERVEDRSRSTHALRPGLFADQRRSTARQIRQASELKSR